MGIHLVHEFHDFLLLDLESQCPHEHLELVQIDAPGLVRIEEFESLAQFLLLVLCEFGPGLPIENKPCGAQ